MVMVMKSWEQVGGKSECGMVDLALLAHSLPFTFAYGQALCG